MSVVVIGRVADGRWPLYCEMVTKSPAGGVRITAPSVRPTDATNDRSTAEPFAVTSFGISVVPASIAAPSSSVMMNSVAQNGPISAPLPSTAGTTQVMSTWLAA